MKNKNKVVFITGASSGIGAALAREYHKRGYRLVLCARRKERLEKLSLELGGAETAFVQACDVSDEKSIEAAVENSIQHFGTIDVVIANAGFGVVGRFEKLLVSDYRRQFETNVFGVISTLEKTLPHIKKSKGSLVLIGSANSYISEPKKSPYCMSKFAIKALADALYWELLSQGVAVTLVCPGLVESEIRRVNKEGVFQSDASEPAPAYFIMPVEKAAKQMVNAIEARKKEIIITGHAKIAVWLQRHFPALLKALFKDAKNFSRPNK